MIHYAKIWLASARYSITRTLMFRGDFFVWALVELFWMTVNLLTISVIYAGYRRGHHGRIARSDACESRSGARRGVRKHAHK